jgi:6-phosphogluconolactonase (cycloisomerase 2 family)
MLAYVGGNTSKDRNGRGDGINVYRVDKVSGAWSHVQHLGDLVNPSWLALDRRRPVLYSAHGEGHEATAYAIEPATGRLRVLNRQPTGERRAARHQASDRYLVCAVYSSGTVAVLPITRRLARTGPDLVPLTGDGPHPEQTSAHHDFASTRAGASAWCRTKA